MGRALYNRDGERPESRMGAALATPSRNRPSTFSIRPLGVDAAEQAEGLRHHLRMLHGATDRLLENSDPDHPELGWTYPAKIGQDNPDGFYMTAPMDLHRSYRLTGRIDTPR